MYSAKAQGKARVAVFDDGMRERVVARLRLENDLRRALERGEFRLKYQPILSMESNRIVSFEALVRWEHPEWGEVKPAEFIPVAEETGLIIQLGHWVLSEACRQMSRWHEMFPADPPLRVAVNLSSKQFVQPDLAAQIGRVLEETGLPPRSLELEITESSIIDNPQSAAAILTKLRAIGVQVSVDDFGTGYSSLSYFQKFTVDTVKIDRSFVRQMGTTESHEIVNAIVNLAHNLKLAVVAEGIENEAQQGRLKALECDFGQGFYFSDPLDSAATEALIALNNAASRAAHPLLILDTAQKSLLNGVCDL